MPSFDFDRFIEDCRAALKEGSPSGAVREVVARAISDPVAVVRTLGEPKRSQIQKLHHAPDLTVINVVWAPNMVGRPHNHRMWAVIGIYTGREDNIFWRRVKDHDGRIEAAGAKALCENDVVQLGRQIIHSVTNPIPRFTGALHVYGGDFFGMERSEWDPESLLEEPYSIERTLRRFEDANPVPAMK